MLKYRTVAKIEIQKQEKINIKKYKKCIDNMQHIMLKSKLSSTRGTNKKVHWKVNNKF